LNKPNFKSWNARGVTRWGTLKLQFDWYITQAYGFRFAVFLFLSIFHFITISVLIMMSAISKHCLALIFVFIAKCLSKRIVCLETEEL